MYADRITPLGKRPVIASLSIGATRIFRLKRATGAAEDPDPPPDKAAEHKPSTPEQCLPEVSLLCVLHEPGFIPMPRNEESCGESLQHLTLRSICNQLACSLA